MKAAPAWTRCLVLFSTVAPYLSTNAPIARINCGGPRISVRNGVDWLADDSAQADGEAVQNGAVSIQIADSPPDEIFLTSREGIYGHREDLMYIFPVSEPGFYSVRLFFVDTFRSSDERQFDIHVHGQLVARGFDITAVMGAGVGSVLHYPAVVDSGDFGVVVRLSSNTAAGAIVSGIEFVRNSHRYATPPMLSAVPCGSTSQRSCDDLGWRYRRSQSEVCGNSGGANGSCPLTSAIQEASLFCSTAGGRLCSALEIMNDATAGSGCSMDSRYVWTSTPCSEGYLVVAGASEMSPAKPSTCQASHHRHAVRCCADRIPCEHPPTSSPTAAPTDLPTRVPTNSPSRPPTSSHPTTPSPTLHPTQIPTPGWHYDSSTACAYMVIPAQLDWASANISCRQMENGAGRLARVRTVSQVALMSRLAPPDVLQPLWVDGHYNADDNVFVGAEAISALGLWYTGEPSFNPRRPQEHCVKQGTLTLRRARDEGQARFDNAACSTLHYYACEHCYTFAPTSSSPTSTAPSTPNPTTLNPTSAQPTTPSPTTLVPTSQPTTLAPTLTPTGPPTVSPTTTTETSTTLTQTSSTRTEPLCIASFLSCNQLQWRFNNRRTAAAADVCSASDLIVSGCETRATQSEAYTLCRSVGARLCTLAEVQGGAAQGSGCSFDFRKIWTSTLCENGTIVAAGNGDSVSQPTQCSEGSARYAVRCCADTEPSSACSFQRSGVENFEGGSTITTTTTQEPSIFTESTTFASVDVSESFVNDSITTTTTTREPELFTTTLTPTPPAPTLSPTESSSTTTTRTANPCAFRQWCENGGTCVIDPSNPDTFGYSCICTGGFSGTHCEILPTVTTITTTSTSRTVTTTTSSTTLPTTTTSSTPEPTSTETAVTTRTTETTITRTVTTPTTITRTVTTPTTITRTVTTPTTITRTVTTPTSVTTVSTTTTTTAEPECLTPSLETCHILYSDFYSLTPTANPPSTSAPTAVPTHALPCGSSAQFVFSSHGTSTCLCDSGYDCSGSECSTALGVSFWDTGVCTDCRCIPASPEPTHRCSDVHVLGSPWRDAAGPQFDCDWYGRVPSACVTYGNLQRYQYGGYTAAQACCACGGGSLIELPAPLICTDKNFTSGKPWHDADGPQYNCIWYQQRPQACTEQGANFAYNNMTAQEACCTCGGGNMVAPPTTPEPSMGSTTTTTTEEPETIDISTLVPPCETSAASCADLGWTSRRAGASVCGAAHQNGICFSNSATYVEAQTFCLSIGARLCREGELVRNIVAPDNCGAEDIFVWTNSPCSSSGTNAIAMPWVVDSINASARECAPMYTRKVSRCCADVEPSVQCQSTTTSSVSTTTTSSITTTSKTTTSVSTSSVTTSSQTLTTVTVTTNTITTVTDTTTTDTSTTQTTPRVCDLCEQDREWYRDLSISRCCYKQSTIRASFADALSECQNLGGSLASIVNESENTFIGTIRSNHRDSWVGGVVSSANLIFWVGDQIASSYVNWYDGEPNNFYAGVNGAIEGCVSYSSASNSIRRRQGTTRWNDALCTNRKLYICEFCPERDSARLCPAPTMSPTEPTPAPSTLSPTLLPTTSSPTVLRSTAAPVSSSPTQTTTTTTEEPTTTVTVITTTKTVTSATSQTTSTISSTTASATTTTSSISTFTTTTTTAEPTTTTTVSETTTTNTPIYGDFDCRPTDCRSFNFSKPCQCDSTCLAFNDCCTNAGNMCGFVMPNSTLLATSSTTYSSSSSEQPTEMPTQHPSPQPTQMPNDSPTADPCNLHICGADCNGSCGWSTVRGECISGAFTNPAEVTSGNCISSGSNEVSSVAPTSPPSTENLGGIGAFGVSFGNGR